MLLEYQNGFKINQTLVERRLSSPNHTNTLREKHYKAQCPKAQLIQSQIFSPILQKKTQISWTWTPNTSRRLMQWLSTSETIWRIQWSKSKRKSRKKRFCQDQLKPRMTKQTENKPFHNMLVKTIKIMSKIKRMIHLTIQIQNQTQSIPQQINQSKTINPWSNWTPR